MDIGAGTGKVWRADTEGFIHDDSHLIANITAAEMEQIGIVGELKYGRHRTYPEAFLWPLCLRLTLTFSLSGSETRHHASTETLS